MADDSRPDRYAALGLDRLAALFPDELRAAQQTAAEERAALGRVDDPAAEPA